jgi:hypothetical protein
MSTRGIARFDVPPFGLEEAAAIHALIEADRRDEADAQLRHLVHEGVPPTQLFEMAMALADQRAGGG